MTSFDGSAPDEVGSNCTAAELFDGSTELALCTVMAQGADAHLSSERARRASPEGPNTVDPQFGAVGRSPRSTCPNSEEAETTGRSEMIQGAAGCTEAVDNDGSLPAET